MMKNQKSEVKTEVYKRYTKDIYILKKSNKKEPQKKQIK